MEYLLLSLAALTSASKGLICKKIGSETKENWRVYLLNSVIFLVASLAVLLYGALCGTLCAPSTFTATLAIGFAALLLFTQISETYAMRLGSASVTILIYSLGLIFPIGYGRIFLSEEISLVQLLGGVLVIMALVFIIDPRGDKKFSTLWLSLSLLACFGSGMTAVVQKIHQSSDVRGELVVFLAIAFAFAALFLFLLSVFSKDKNTSLTLTSDNLKFTLFSGICIGMLNILNLFLAGKLPAIIQFPIYNIGSMILTGVGGRLFFGERMPAKKLVGFAVGCVAIIMIGLG